MGIPLRVLFIEDNPDDVQLVVLELQRSGYDVREDGFTRVDTRPALVAALRQPWDIVISDFQMPALTGPEALGILKEEGVGIPFIIVSGTVDEEQAVAALRSGAADFVSKQKLARLGPAIARELQDHAEREARRKAEGQLLRAQKMDAIGQLAGGVAHDLNNILSVILGHSEIVARHVGPASDDHRRLTAIGDAAERAAGLVRQLLAVGSRQVLQPKVLSLNGVVQDTLRMLERVIGEHITIEAVLDGALSPVCADVAQCEQVVMNLVINARDAMPGGGTLRIVTRDVQAYALLEVQDTGCGMDEATQARIFEPFYTTKEPGKGTGLGLATVYGVVKQSGGHIEVESRPGEGTTFRVYLPRAAEKGATAPAVRTTKAEGGAETVLLVEDDPATRSIAAEILHEAGYDLLVADSAERALEISRSRQGAIQLLLTDVVMPKENGFAVARQMREMRPDTKVLFMSGYTEPTNERQAFPAPFLAKPFTYEDLLVAVRSALDA
jgi:two-component system, cell cycle sensor histidine kinase and response regulator CckA